MSTTDVGFFKEAELDRINMKTLGNQLPEPYEGSDLMALLFTKVYESDRDSLVAKRQVIEWYCKSPVADVVKELEAYADNEEYENYLRLFRFMHTATEEELEKMTQYLLKHQNQ